MAPLLDVAPASHDRHPGPRRTLVVGLVWYRYRSRFSNLRVAERKRAENELRQMESQLTHVGRLSLMGEMTTCIAHEVNQPLVAILIMPKHAETLLVTN